MPRATSSCWRCQASVLCCRCLSLSLQAELAVAEDFDQIRTAMEKCPPYQAIFSRVRGLGCLCCTAPMPATSLLDRPARRSVQPPGVWEHPAC